MKRNSNYFLIIKQKSNEVKCYVVKNTWKKKQKTNTKKRQKKEKRADFVISINPKIIIPVEVEKTGNIRAGLEQIENYKNPLEKKLKLFKTKDSIAEFIELNTQNQELFTALDY